MNSPERFDPSQDPRRVEPLAYQEASKRDTGPHEPETQTIASIGAPTGRLKATAVTRFPIPGTAA
jgi:hypothetical protein